MTEGSVISKRVGVIVSAIVVTVVLLTVVLPMMGAGHTTANPHPSPDDHMPYEVVPLWYLGVIFAATVAALAMLSVLFRLRSEVSP